MKRMPYCLLVPILISITSCSRYMDEWDNTEPVSVMYFDGIELREHALYDVVMGGLYGPLYVQIYENEMNNSIHLVYTPRNSYDKEHTISVFWNGFAIDSSSQESFEGDTLHYSMGDNGYYSCLRLTRNNTSEWMDVTTADVLISDLQRYSDPNYYLTYDCRIDYSMEVVDSLDIVHKVNGWAIPGNRTKH